MEVIYDYHAYNHEVQWKPHFLGTRIRANDFLIGIEHELELGGEDEDNALAITKAMGHPCNDGTFDIICSHDGSLDDGIEFITQPATYDYHMNKDGKGYNWEAGLAKARALGYIGESDTREDEDGDEYEAGGHAGTHYNISRKSLQGKYDTEENMMMLFLNNKDWLMERFSRRMNTRNKFHYCSYEENAPKILPTEVRNDLSGVKSRLQRMVRRAHDHYSAVNLEKQKVIELRFMTSTNYYKWFVAGLQLVVMMSYCVKNMSLEEISAVRFPWFLQCARANGYVEFIDYCRYHRINISPTQYAF